MPKTIKSYHPSAIEIDGDPIRLRIRRLTLKELDAIEKQMARYGFHLGQIRHEVPAEIEVDELASFLTETISENVLVEPGDLIVEGEDGTDRSVREGRELVALYGARDDVLPELIALIYAENRLPEQAKKNWKSAPVSSLGSAIGPPPPDAGASPAPIAEPAADSGTARNEAVTASSEDDSSGMTAPCDSEPVLSER